VSHPWTVILLSGVLAGWLMGLLSWLVAASRDTISQVFMVWLVTFVIGLAHLHHSVAGSAEVLAGVFSGQGATAGDFLHFLSASTLGNAVGGIVFVAVIKYGHARGLKKQ
jgi:formate-nitrite transporter family protein